MCKLQLHEHKILLIDKYLTYYLLKSLTGVKSVNWFSVFLVSLLLRSGLLTLTVAAGQRSSWDNGHLRFMIQ